MAESCGYLPLVVNIRTRHSWSCRGRYGIGTGETPEEAYEDYRLDVEELAALGTKGEYRDLLKREGYNRLQVAWKLFVVPLRLLFTIE